MNHAAPTGFFTTDTCDLAAFRAQTGQTLTQADAPHCAGIIKNIPVYDMSALDGTLTDPNQRPILLAEWADVLGRRSGVLVLRRAYADTAPIDAATAVYDSIIAREKAQSGGRADHFATAGANDRVWNSLQKLCVASPETFARYFGNPAIAAVCEAWLGPNYQMTAQVNLVRPGGQAQQAHRDYHLGFQSAEVSAQYPAHVHDLTPALTLQGAVAHTDMPVESGPTKLLPFSQLYRPGYTAWRLPEFREYFEAHHVQVPLEKGDAVFFSPALFHAAGANVSADVQRMANLLQVSSAFGRAMESVDRAGMSRLLYPVLAGLAGDGSLSQTETDAAIAACAEGYSFPTNLDRDPPVGGLAPETQAALFRRALAEGWAPAVFNAALDAQALRQTP
jgi:ectoine hydroxylase-related dioxygenase (phytanoyl-CoA dioxygenase family)